MTTNTHIAAQARTEAEKIKRLGAQTQAEADYVANFLLKCAQALEAAPALDAQGEAPVHQRWNIDRDGDDLLVCFGDHDKHEDCSYRRFSPPAPPPPAVDVQVERTPRFWKVGDELLPFHKSASHVSPDYRDGWNACWYALKNDTIAVPPPPAVGKPLSDEEVDQVDQWQDIESAPKDGTEILAWRQDAGAFIALYTSMSELPMTQEEIDKFDEETLFHEDWFTQWPQALRLDGSEAPTHWMHLPCDPPPKEAQITAAHGIVTKETGNG